MGKAEGLPPSSKLLDSATLAIRRASVCLGEATPRAMDECIPLLEEALWWLNGFPDASANEGPEETTSLKSRAEELKESLIAFLTLASQMRAYYESVSAEVAQGQVSYTPLAVTMVNPADCMHAFAEV